MRQTHPRYIAPNIDSSKDFPVGYFYELCSYMKLQYELNDDTQSLEEAKKMPAKKKLPLNSRPPRDQPPSPVHEGFFNEDLDIKVLKKELTRENYVRRFHHLLKWEEQEHYKTLKEK